MTVAELIAKLQLLPPELPVIVDDYQQFDISLRANWVDIGGVEPPADPEACPGCGGLPGDGTNPSCSHPAGCGFYHSLES